MAINPTTTLSQSRVDRSGEIGRYSVHVAAATNFDIPLSAAMTDFFAAVESVCNGIATTRSVNLTEKLTNVANSTTGQREEKWLVTYEDDVTKALYQTELPCRDTAIQPPVNTDEVDLTVSPWVAFVAAWEAFVLSPDGNGTNVMSVRLIGRNV